jgi:hypothetical protein
MLEIDGDMFIQRAKIPYTGRKTQCYAKVASD